MFNKTPLIVASAMITLACAVQANHDDFSVNERQNEHLKSPKIEIDTPKAGQKLVSARRLTVKGSITIKDGEWTPALGVLEVKIAKDKQLKYMDWSKAVKLAQESETKFTFEVLLESPRPLKKGKHYISVRRYRRYDKSAPATNQLNPETARSETLEIEVYEANK